MRNRKIVLKQAPAEKLSEADFQMVEGRMPRVSDGQVLVRTRYVAIDAASRTWMAMTSYRPVVAPGDVMPGPVLAEVLESRVAGFTQGELVYADTGWQEYACVDGNLLMKAPDTDPETYALSVYGVAGLTAYFGLLRCGEPRSGETVVISAAAGAVGSLAGQIARILGCRVIGIAGSAQKCEFLTNRLRFDHAIDYTAGDVYSQLAALCPNGIDVYFDNVGGEVFEACLFNMGEGGRIVCCGVVSAYDASEVQSVRGVPVWLIAKRLRMHGFMVTDFYCQRTQAVDRLQHWVREGALVVSEDILEGFERLPSALVGLLAGQNIGKRIVRVG